MIVCGMAIIAATIHNLFLFLQQFTKLRSKKNSGAYEINSELL